MRIEDSKINKMIFNADFSFLFRIISSFEIFRYYNDLLYLDNSVATIILDTFEIIATKNILLINFLY